MPKYTLTACVMQTRSYTVAAANEDEAREFLEAEYDYVDFDVVDTELQNITVEDSE